MSIISKKTAAGFTYMFAAGMVLRPIFFWGSQNTTSKVAATVFSTFGLIGAYYSTDFVVKKMNIRAAVLFSIISMLFFINNKMVWTDPIRTCYGPREDGTGLVFYPCNLPPAHLVSWTG